MAIIVTRAGKGSPLTFQEGDANFINLNEDIEALQSEVGSGGAIDIRLDALESADVVMDSRLDAVEALNTTQNSRLNAVESVNTTQNSQISALQAVDAALDGRIDTLEISGTRYAATKAAGDTLAASLADGATVMVTADESLGGLRVRYTVASGALAGGVSDTAAMVQFTQAGTGAVPRTSQDKMREFVSVKDFGADPTGVDFSTSSIWAAIESLRANPVSILDTIGGNFITAYSSGVVLLPPGIFKINPDNLKISQDLGLTLKGSGSRKTNNSVRASTTLLISGASSGFGIQAYRSGARGLTIEDMDICYETSDFTGDVLDVLDCPGVTLNRVFLGTFGLTNGTRLQTAFSCLRSTYDEFMHLTDCVVDGAVRGWWSDDTRTELGNSFGGSLTKFDTCTFYDFSENQVYQAGNRTRSGVVFTNCAFNPISVSPSSSCWNMDNIDGLTIEGCGFAASVSNAPAAQWLRATNCTGSISGNFLDDLAPAGQISGFLDFSGNRIACTDGIIVRAGVITGRANEFSDGTSGWIFSPDTPLCFDVGPDLFKSPVTYSYDIPADSANLAGRVNYDSGSDLSVSKFRNVSARVSIKNIDAKLFTVSNASYNISILDTGRTILAIGGSNQTFNLPTPVPGTKIIISKISGVDLVVNCAGGTHFYGIGTTVYSVATLSGPLMGTIELESFAAVGWIVKAEVNSWAFS
jgi:hypothetical protein